MILTPKHDFSPATSFPPRFTRYAGSGYGLSLIAPNMRFFVHFGVLNPEHNIAALLSVRLLENVIFCYTNSCVEHRARVILYYPATSASLIRRNICDGDLRADASTRTVFKVVLSEKGGAAH